MRLSRALVEKAMDIRVRDKFVGEDKLSKKTLDEYFSSLPDDYERMTVTNLNEEDSEEEQAQVENPEPTI